MLLLLWKEGEFKFNRDSNFGLIKSNESEMNLSKKIARTIVYPGMMKFKLDKYLRSKSENKLLNVMYHGVVKTDSTFFSPRHLIESQFEKQIKYISSEFDVITVVEAFEIIKNNKPLKRKTVTITFDDGYLNNLTTALPILEYYNVPTSFFISTATLNNPIPNALWSDVIAALLYFHKNKSVQIDTHVFNNGYCSQLNVSLFDYMKTLDCKSRDLILNNLIEKYQLDECFLKLEPEIWQLLNHEELRKLSGSKIASIGSHGHQHYNLGHIGIEDAISDMSTSIKLLENCINKKIDMIAYPDGSYSEQVKVEAEKLGLIYQMAVNYKLEGDLIDARITNRHGISSTTTYESNIINLNRAFKSKGIKSK
jgi:peptidoglycan/xylan/chitin deacetylase (PgdA/CDA1 family)